MKTCEICKKEFIPSKHSKGRFCSMACYNMSRPKATKVCGCCKEEFYVTRSRLKYCSRACANKGRTGIKYDGTRLYDKANRRLRQYMTLAEERGENCECCGMPPIWNGKPLTLHVDHIDGNNSNNLIENLRLLCPNCHAQTDTYGSKNITKRRKTED